ncbi:hypothetical protein MPSEU_000086700 [Mayamaea pseudoterrestris]|nr:hypothetical protein MPSEU_000086700 [Mayamaea pseudoterrestris]
MKFAAFIVASCFALCNAQHANVRQANIDMHAALFAHEEEYKESLNRILGERSYGWSSIQNGSSKSKGSKGVKGSKSTKGSKGYPTRGTVSSVTSAEYTAGSGAVSTGLGYAAATLLVVAAANV